mmetsp:Transcript_954/g.1695  ORF Transcript_954/g.1695 Transcript_954/m.1695 type:complete len:164 (+) Transcript_954:1181-1672(+)
MRTQTISLFDPEIKSAKLYGEQFHFHSPCEHSIDGKLMDLEMHVVHMMEPKYAPGSEDPAFEDDPKSQFMAGVLGFIFKVVPEEFFDHVMHEYPDLDIDYHDLFLSQLASQRHRGEDQDKLDLTEFVAKLNFQRRFTYQGSLTTAPCSEGILWNIVEQVIPIR